MKSSHIHDVSQKVSIPVVEYVVWIIILWSLPVLISGLLVVSIHNSFHAKELFDIFIKMVQKKIQEYIERYKVKNMH